MKGIIVKGIGGFYYVRTEKNEIVECRARGIFRKENMKPQIGDHVEISVEHGTGNVEKIGERRNFLVRPPVCNVDSLMIVAAAKSPDPDFLLLDKLLVTAEEKGIVPIICVNKTDLKSAEEIREIYKNTGYAVIAVNALTGEGTEELKTVLKDRVTALAGLSGVGKSSILNRLIDYGAKTGGISKINRGRHTTRHVELFELSGGGFIFDTPGFSSFEPERMLPEDLAGYFPEMRGAPPCRFKGCAHINEPDCGVKEKLGKGELSEKRYESYKEIYALLKQRKEW